MCPNHHIRNNGSDPYYPHTFPYVSPAFLTIPWSFRLQRTISQDYIQFYTTRHNNSSMIFIYLNRERLRTWSGLRLNLGLSLRLSTRCSLRSRTVEVRIEP